MSTWTRAEDGHPRWEIKNPSGDGRNYLVTDEAIRTFGRELMTELMINLPPLPEQAWTPPARKEVTIMTNRDPEPGICGHPGSSGGVCGLVPGHRGPHRPLHVRQDPEPIRTPQDMILAYPGMTLEQAIKLLAEADLDYQAGAPQTLGVFIGETRDVITRTLERRERLTVTRQDDGSYLVTVTDEVGPGTEDRQAERRMPQQRRSEALARQAEPGRDDLEADPEAMAKGDRILGGQGEAVLRKPLGPREERGE